MSNYNLLANIMAKHRINIETMPKQNWIKLYSPERFLKVVKLVVGVYNRSNWLIRRKRTVTMTRYVWSSNVINRNGVITSNLF